MDQLGYELNVPGAVSTGIHAPVPGAYGLDFEAPPPPNPMSSRRQRILAHAEWTRQARDKAENDAALDSATELLAREQSGAADAEERLKRAYDRLGVAAPQMQDSKLSFGETLAAVLGGLSGDPTAALNSAYALADLRNQREYKNSLTQFEADQRTAGLDAELAGRDLARSQSAMDRLDQFRIGRQADLADQAINEQRYQQGRADRTQELQLRADERKLTETSRLHDDALTRLRTVRNPAQVPLMVREVNRLRGELGIDLIPESEVSAIMDEVGQASRSKALSEKRMLMGAYTKVLEVYGGQVPESIRAEYNGALKGLEDEYGIPMGTIDGSDAPTLRRQDVEADNARGDRALDIREKELAVRSNLAVEQIRKMRADMQRDNSKLALEIAKWESGDGPRPDGKIGTEIGKLRTRQKALALDRQVAWEKKQKLPPSDARSDEQEELFDKYTKEIAKLNEENQDIERKLRMLNAIRETPDPEVAPMAIPQGGLSPFFGPVDSGRRGTKMGTGVGKPQAPAKRTTMGTKGGPAKAPSTGDLAKARGL